MIFCQSLLEREYQEKYLLCDFPDSSRGKKPLQILWEHSRFIVKKKAGGGYFT